jgi:hypothetical protein
MTVKSTVQGSDELSAATAELLRFYGHRIASPPTSWRWLVTPRTPPSRTWRAACLQDFWPRWWKIFCKFQIVMLWIALTELITVSKYTGELWEDSSYFRIGNKKKGCSSSSSRHNILVPFLPLWRSTSVQAWTLKICTRCISFRFKTEHANISPMLTDWVLKSRRRSKCSNKLVTCPIEDHM